MTVQELIDKLQTFDPNLRVVDDYMLNIETVIQCVWVDSNYPYDRPDEDVVVIQ